MDRFSSELLVIQSGFLVILFTMLLWLWISNRKKYHQYKHAIPAAVVKNYLDSVIQNSLALKSSLFRGGAQEIDGVPSVFPVDKLSSQVSVALEGSSSATLIEELNQKKAQVSSVMSQLSSTQTSQKELELKLRDSLSKVKELEAILDQVRAGSADDMVGNQLQSITRERDDLKDKLREFEIIADDLANLKRLQQENEQLKRSLKEREGGIKSPEVTVPVPEFVQPIEVAKDLFEDTTQIEEAQIAAEKAAEAQVQVQATAEIQEEAAPKKSEKTADDLLSEFEKMLG